MFLSLELSCKLILIFSALGRGDFPVCEPSVQGMLHEIDLWGQTFGQGHDVVCRTWRPCPFPTQVSGTGLEGL